MGCFFPSSPLCVSTAPNANPDASTSSSKGLVRFGWIRTGSDVIL
jgi:hypothetical protein